MSTSFNAAKRSSALAAKKTDLVFKESKLPAASLDFTTIYKANSSAVVKQANLFTIDVFPNFVPILMFIMYNCSQSIHSIDARAHAKVTLPTYVMYCLTLVYGHILLSDMFIRPTPSEYAQDYHSVPAKFQFAELLLTLPVPAFLEPLLKKLTCTTTAKRSNIIFCPSAAGFTLPTHFGRFFPINMFTNIHDLTAELDSRSTPHKILLKLFSEQIFSVSNPDAPSQDFYYTAAHFLGACFLPDHKEIKSSDTTKHSDFQTLLRQSFDAAFNPVLSKDYTRRSSLSPIVLQPPVFKSRNFNPYDVLFAFSPSNFSEIRVVLQSIASVINGAIPVTKQLAQLYETTSGQGILTHGYSSFALPTFHHSPSITESFEIDSIKNPLPTRVHPEKIADLLHFLPSPTFSAAQHDKHHSLPTAECHDDPTDHTADITTLSPEFQLLRNVTISDPPVRVPSLPEFLKFDESKDVAPLVLCLDPNESDTESAWMTTAFGFVIETLEIDASAISFPNPESNLALENAKFMESAIPYQYVVRSTLFSGSDNYHYARRRTPETRNNFKAASLFVDFSKVYIARPILSTIDTLRNNGFPGLTFRDNTTWIRQTQAFFGFKAVSSRPLNKTETTIPHLAPGHVYIWSPYSYTPVAANFSNPNSRFGYNDSNPESYFLSNLRTIFGTDCQLMELTHAFEAMPIA
jgi:hypothetical protein